MKNSRLPMGIRLGISNSEPGVHLLIVTGNEDYNQTEIVCIARFDNDNASEPEQVRQASQPAYLNVSCKLNLIRINLKLNEFHHDLKIR